MRFPNGTWPIRIVIGLAVIVVIVSIALPAWRIHNTRSHVIDATRAVDAAKLMVMEAATVHGGLDPIHGASLPAQESGSLTSPYAASVHIGDGGRITLTTRDTGSDRPPVLQYVPHSAASAGIGWTCTVLSGDASLAPEECVPAAVASAGK